MIGGTKCDEMFINVNKSGVSCPMFKFIIIQLEIDRYTDIERYKYVNKDRKRYRLLALKQGKIQTRRLDTKLWYKSDQDNWY